MVSREKPAPTPITMHEDAWIALMRVCDCDTQAGALLHLLAATELSIEEALSLTIADVDDAATDHVLSLRGIIEIESEVWEDLHAAAQMTDSELTGNWPAFYNPGRPLFSLPFRIGPQDAECVVGPPLVEGRIALPLNVAQLIVIAAGARANIDVSPILRRTPMPEAEVRRKATAWRAERDRKALRAS